MFLACFLMCCLLLSACGSTPTETPIEPPAEPSEQESSLTPESSAAPAEKPEPQTTEPQIYIIEGYSLEELGYSVTIPEEFETITDPNHTDERANCFFDVRHSKQSEKLHAFVSFLNGGFTEIDISVAEDLAFNPYTLRLLQGYRFDELTDEKDRVRIGDEYLTAALLDDYAVYKNDKVIICDFTDLYYYHTYSATFAQAAESWKRNSLDYGWLVPIYDSLGTKIEGMIVPAYEPNDEQNWETIDRQVAKEIWTSYESFWNGPKNRFAHFSHDEIENPTFWWGLWDADGGRGYGTMIKMMRNDHGDIKAFIYYPEHPETEFMSYRSSETAQLLITEAGDGKLILQYSDCDASEFYKAGSDFKTAYNAYAAIHHNW